MDVTPYLPLRTAPHALFDALAERGSRVRFLTRSVRAGAPDWDSVTWAEHARQVRQIACWLSTPAGEVPALLGAGERAAILGANRVEWMSAALAIQAVGGVMVPVYPSSTAEQMAYVLEHSDARVVFVGPGGAGDGAARAELLARLLAVWPRLAGVRAIVLLDEALDIGAALAASATARPEGGDAPPWDEVRRRVVGWADARRAGATRDAAEPGAFERRLGTVTIDRPAVMLYTSGTSGNPKGVPLTHENIAVNASDWLRCNAPLLSDGDVDLLWLPMSHIFGFGEACLGNTLGFTSYLCEPAAAVSLLPEVRPTVFMSVPSVWEKLSTMASRDGVPDAARLREVTGGRLRFCLSGGAGLKREVKERFFSAGMLIIEGYGLTETSPTLTLNRPDAFRFDSVGKPLPAVQLRLAEDGEILARGPSVFGGYHKDAGATREAFTDDGWFKTGDIGRFTDDGFLQIVDRKKDILVTAGGKNVPPANIELRFRDDPFIAHVVVYGDGKRYLVAGVWLHEAVVDAHLAAAGVRPEARDEAARALVQTRIEQVNGALASFETIKRFTVFPGALGVENGMLTPTLKLRRKQVYQAFGPALEALYGDATPTHVDSSATPPRVDSSATPPRVDSSATPPRVDPDAALAHGDGAEGGSFPARST
jgi:long-chain acyl-CoA synthetase